MAFLFYLVLILLVLFFIIITSRIEVEISNLKYSRVSKKDFFKNKIDTIKEIDFLVKIRLYILNKIPIITFNINKGKLNRLEKNKAFQNIQKKLRKRLNMFELKIIEDLNNKDKKIFNDIVSLFKKKNIKIKQLDMNIKLGLENLIATTMMIPIISTAISFLLQNLKNDTKKSKYRITPLYNLEGTRSVLEIYLECIFEVRMVMKKFGKKIPKKVLTFN